MGLNFSELIVIFVVFLVLFGPEKLPEIARTLGKLTGELKRASDSLRREFYNSVYTPNSDTLNLLKDEQRKLVAMKEEVLSKEAPPPEKTLTTTVKNDGRNSDN